MLLLATALALVNGCGGWHLRGVGSGADDHRYTYFLRASGANEVFIALRQEIVNRGSYLTTKLASAQIVVDIERERFDRRILSIDPNTGKVREIELGLSIMFSARSGDGKLLIPREEATFEQDYVFDEGSVLGTTEVDVIVRRDLAQLAATSIALRLQATRLPETSAGG
ncbi:MAG: hypothetical protein KDK06_10995 [Gammaproteobacteria bacterium]|nr:hypothetical protein [Gammaproteobacteria bacterium]